MKINKIFIGGLAMLSLTACNDYLDVEPATNVADLESVYSAESEVDKALNGVYAKIQTDATFGSDLYVTFQLNSDVDFASNGNETAQGNQPRRFDLRADASNVEKLWNNLYSGVEAANEFIYNLQNSPLYVEGTTTEAVETDNGLENKEVPEVTNLTQMMGEAKVMRAMFYHELLSYWGDIPFTLEATYQTDNLVPDITARQEVSDALIADLEHAAEYMYSDKDYSQAPERISQEAAYAMIARLALQAGGYSLNHDANDATNYKMTRPSDYKKYYQIARDYTKKIIDAGGHALNKSYRDVFVDECNFVATQGDDPIFEIPFAKATNSNWGYAQGPTNGVDTDDPNYSNSAWGATSGGVRTSAFYRYSFDKKDLRRDYINGLWYYSNQGLPTMRLDYAMHNNKWSKLWNTNGLGSSTTSATGINFAYIRYADVLLMFAEAENEVNGPTADAQEALKTVRRRAFDTADRADKVETYVAQAAASKEDFLKAVLDERKWEFAGENMRWKDLVRNNMYAEKVFMTFLTYFSVAENMAGSSQFLDMVEEYDGVPYNETFVDQMYSILVKNYNDPNFPNTGVYMFYVVNPYEAIQNPTGSTPTKWLSDNDLENIEPVSARTITGLSTASTSVGWTTTALAWSNDDGTAKNQILYSLYGYVRVDQANNIVVVDNGSVQRFAVNPSSAEANISRLPAVRYLLPIPQEAIARSNGVYRNYYGY